MLGLMPKFTATVSILAVKSLFRLAGRQATGLIASLFRWMQVELLEPDHSPVS
jgi:hypothetical protein